ncbi:hypothetical protein [Nereida sp. MMG025]|uniref:hypothetical protein n=1 Tax=Nereida sp. MMG025 TaxID=2909981 RepID=UPI001F34D86E|nr:hypothetical protein [Nereida sp. MMG025]
MSAVDVWQMLHSNAQEWETVPRNSHFFKIREMLDQADRDALKKLEDYDALLWEHLCYGAGWTIIGAVALSWCKGANLAQISKIWQSISPEIALDPATLRVIGMLRPQLLPASDRLSEIAASLEGDVFLIALSIIALQGKIHVDVQRSELENAPDLLRFALIYMAENAEGQCPHADLILSWKTDERQL